MSDMQTVALPTLRLRQLQGTLSRVCSKSVRVRTRLRVNTKKLPFGFLTEKNTATISFRKSPTQNGIISFYHQDGNVNRETPHFYRADRQCSGVAPRVGKSMQSSRQACSHRQGNAVLETLQENRPSESNRIRIKTRKVDWV